MWLHSAHIPKIPSKFTTSWTDMQENSPPQLRPTWGVGIVEGGRDRFHIALWWDKRNLAREERSAICYYYRWKYFCIPHEWLFAYHLQKVTMKWKRSWIVYSLILMCAGVRKQTDLPVLGLKRNFQKQWHTWKSHGSMAAGLSKVAVT